MTKAADEPSTVANSKKRGRPKNPQKVDAPKVKRPPGRPRTKPPKTEESALYSQVGKRRRRGGRVCD